MTQRLKVRTLTAFATQGERPCQEDHVQANRERGIFSVADGFGGPDIGEHAAKEACSAVIEFLQRESGDEEATFPFIRKSSFSLSGNILFNSVIHANRKVMRLNQNQSIHQRGGASVLAACVDGDILSIANVGVCSAWLLREGRWVELVAPKSYARMCDPFIPNPDELLSVPLVSLGTHQDIEPEIVEYRVHLGDVVLFQTDGVNWELRELIARVQATSASPSDAARQTAEELESLGKDRKFSDNTSLLLINF